MPLARCPSCGRVADGTSCFACGHEWSAAEAPPPVATPTPAPAPAPTPRTAPAEPEQIAVARRDTTALAPVDGDAAGAPRITRRAVRRADEGAAPQEFGFFTVVAGSFEDFSAATSRRNQLREEGHDAIVTIVAPNNGPREYRVQIGSYTRRAEADDVASQVGRLGIRARVVQEG
jgi:cell division protein FtsN